MKVKEDKWCHDKERSFHVGKHLRLSIDYDDVDHDKVDKEIEKLVKILNEHW